MVGYSLLLEKINSTNILVAITFLYALFLSIARKGYSRYLLLLLACSFLNECLYLISLYVNIGALMLFSDSYLIIHHLIWLLLLQKMLDKRSFANFVIALFLIFSITEMLVLKQKNYIVYSFVMGSLCYVVLIFNESFRKLKDEQFDFIFSNNFLLLCAPVLFFFGMSLMFAFVEKKIRSFHIIGTFSLYEVVNYFTSFIYYTLILFYLYRQSKLSYERK